MRREGKTAYEIAEFYTQTFFQDLKWLNIISADVYPKATEHITEQIAMVRTLEAKGYTYHTSDGIYFDTSKLPEYGRLSGQKIEDHFVGVNKTIKTEEFRKAAVMGFNHVVDINNMVACYSHSWI